MVKIGSLQSFMENSGSCEDIGPAGFPVEEVHKITVLDIRLANADRHAGNILMSKDDDGRTLLIPIDHGYCLPESVSLVNPHFHLKQFIFFLLHICHYPAFACHICFVME